MFAAISIRDVRPIGVLIGGTGRCRAVFFVPARLSALLRPQLLATRSFNALSNPHSCFASSATEGSHD